MAITKGGRFFSRLLLYKNPATANWYVYGGKQQFTYNALHHLQTKNGSEFFNPKEIEFGCSEIHCFKKLF